MKCEPSFDEGVLGFVYHHNRLDLDDDVVVSSQIIEHNWTLDQYRQFEPINMGAGRKLMEIETILKEGSGRANSPRRLMSRYITTPLFSPKP